MFLTFYVFMKLNLFSCVRKPDVVGHRSVILLTSLLSKTLCCLQRFEQPSDFCIVKIDISFKKSYSKCLLQNLATFCCKSLTVFSIMTLTHCIAKILFLSMFRYSTFLVRYSYIMVAIVVVLTFFSLILSTVEGTGAKPYPDFGNPTKVIFSCFIFLIRF